MLLNSRYDGLTLLLNRKVFTRQLFRCKKSNVRYGVIMMDIDDFKHVNDTYGHIEGDRVLQRLGQLLQTEIKSDVQCFRYGGEDVLRRADENLYTSKQNGKNQVTMGEL
ncbi:diguanylate cyclase (GGDEF) domain-containing protein [Pseudobutyrivibrio sp. UC1225]|uniref:GGDEF domain-containing protein n=1 Tax=Pseudobutyrivibrio sp. UC1225 TaxID=1798185 RepID=UPI0008F3B2E2|nr:GGDEF domain-containing protein [Pseudobutyrivibrio sp. UC1225]SFN95887.1 diguanylate cyclase (GGDEF) domain-containing protein [Pseudobutyrivibrio sp. UC1225]